jgi:hypothetical protein
VNSKYVDKLANYWLYRVGKCPTNSDLPELTEEQVDLVLQRMVKTVQTEGLLLALFGSKATDTIYFDCPHCQSDETAYSEASTHECNSCGETYPLRRGAIHHGIYTSLADKYQRSPAYAQGIQK